MIFYSSDWHFGHKNICYGTSSWDDKETNCRKFNTIEEMNYNIIKSINDVVGFDDELYFIGDLSFGGIENIWNTIKQINCKNIHCIYGNHDHHIKKNALLPNCHWDLKNDIIVDGSPTEVYEKGHVGNEYMQVYAHDLFKSVNEILTITVEKQEMVLCHYPLEHWKDMEKGVWHLFGHTHGNLPEYTYKRHDVGLDANCFEVLSFEQLKKIMSNRKNKGHR